MEKKGSILELPDWLVEVKRKNAELYQQSPAAYELKRKKAREAYEKRTGVKFK